MSCCPKVFVAVLGVILLSSVCGETLTPPIEMPELKRGADLIVKGEITDVSCAPRGYEQSEHATWTWYVATLTINTLKKGKWPGKTIPILFSSVRYVRGYVGDADHIHHVGERGFYYLVSRGDGYWAPMNWSAVEVKRRGSGPLPACR